MICNKDCFNCIHPDCIRNEPENSSLEYKRNWYRQHAEESNGKKRKQYYERKAKGICTKCGVKPIAKNSVAYCTECLLKHRRASREYDRKKGGLPQVLLDGVTLCKRCGKSEPVKGYKLCERCLKSARDCLEIARKKVQ